MREIGGALFEIQLAASDQGRHMVRILLEGFLEVGLGRFEVFEPGKRLAAAGVDDRQEDLGLQSCCLKIRTSRS